MLSRSFCGCERSSYCDVLRPVVPVIPLVLVVYSILTSCALFGAYQLPYFEESFCNKIPAFHDYFI